VLIPPVTQTPGVNPRPVAVGFVIRGGNGPDFSTSNFVLTIAFEILVLTWQGIDYKLPEDDTIVSKHVAV